MGPLIRCRILAAQLRNKLSKILTSKRDVCKCDARIIRHRGKIEATIANARATLALDRPLDDLLWSFAPPARSAPPLSFTEVPATTAESTAMSRALRTHGFRFVGPTTMYALMQSTGMVDDHLAGCFRSGSAKSTAA